MPEIKSGEESLQQGPFEVKAGNLSEPLRRRFSAPYKMMLFTSDGFLIICAFFLSALVSGYTAGTDGNQNVLAIVLLVMATITVSFFTAYNLYSYHAIYSIRKHFHTLCIALGWSALAIFLMFLMYAWPWFINNTFFFPLLFLLAMGILVISRFFASHMLNILKLMGLSFMATGFFGLIDPDTIPAIILNRPFLLLGFFLSVLFVVAGRYFVVHVVFNVWMKRWFRRQVIIIGSDKAAIHISDHVIHCNAPFWINGVVIPDADRKPGQGLNACVYKDCLGTLTHLPDILENHATQEIIVTDESMNKSALIYLIEFCTHAGVNIWFRPELMPIIDIKLYIDHFCGIPMVRLNTRKNQWVVNKVKHAFDAVVTLPLFVLVLPLFLTIGIAIKLNSKGPVFYRAKALGKGARLFTMYKFRSMRTDADHEHHKEFVTKLIKGEINNPCGDRPLKIVDDPRVTGVGRILRKLSLDELPQLINVLKGDMSLVGPRPCLPYEYEIYKEWHKRRTSVRPGITGLWQVTGRSEVEFEDMILLDLYYIYKRDIGMDISILYETMFVVLGKKGAY